MPFLTVSELNEIFGKSWTAGEAMYKYIVCVNNLNGDSNPTHITGVSYIKSEGTWYALREDANGESTYVTIGYVVLSI